MSEIRVTSKVIKLHVDTGYASSSHEDEMDIPEDWDSLPEDEKESFLNEAAMDFLYNCCESAAWIEDREE